MSEEQPYQALARKPDYHKWIAAELKKGCTPMQAIISTIAKECIRRALLRMMLLNALRGRGSEGGEDEHE